MLKLTRTLSQRKGRLELAQRTGVNRWRGDAMARQLKGKEQKHRLVVGNKLMCLKDEDWNNIEDRVQLERCGCSQTREPPYTLYWH